MARWKQNGSNICQTGNQKHALGTHKRETRLQNKYTWDQMETAWTKGPKTGPRGLQKCENRSPRSKGNENAKMQKAWETKIM